MKEHWWQLQKINLNKKTNIEDEEIKSFSAGNHKLPPVDVQKIIRVVSFWSQEIFNFAEYSQIYEDVNGYISAHELEYSYSKKTPSL